MNTEYKTTKDLERAIAENYEFCSRGCYKNGDRLVRIDNLWRRGGKSTIQVSFMKEGEIRHLNNLFTKVPKRAHKEALKFLNGEVDYNFYA